LRLRWPFDTGTRHFLMASAFPYGFRGAWLRREPSVQKGRGAAEMSVSRLFTNVFNRAPRRPLGPWLDVPQRISSPARPGAGPLRAGTCSSASNTRLRKGRMMFGRDAGQRLGLARRPEGPGRLPAAGPRLRRKGQPPSLERFFLRQRKHLSGQGNSAKPPAQTTHCRRGFIRAFLGPKCVMLPAFRRAPILLGVV
jgi:hypothetical protein